MKKNFQFLTVLLGFLIFITVMIIINTVSSRLKMVPDNEPGTLGNTAGNLYNSGLFCESGGVVYFSNPYDNGSLYAMDPGQTNIRKICAGNISQINAAGNYLYYYISSTAGQAGLGYVRDSRGIYRTDKKGEKVTAISRAISDGVMLVDNHIYFTSFRSDPEKKGNALVTLHRIDLNGQTTEELFQEHIKLGCGYGGQVYFAGINEDHYLYAYDPVSGSTSIVNDSTYIYLPVISGGYLYYLDLMDDYHLKACSLSDGSVKTIVDERVDAYNIYDSVIYYQNAVPGNYALKRIYTDGTGAEVVKTGAYNRIHITSEYTYFYTFHEDYPIYMTPTNGSINVSVFDGAMEAVLAGQ